MSDQNNTNNDDHSLEERPDFHVNTGEFFSSIPVLKKDKNKRDDFSFEKFDDKEAADKIHQNLEDNAETAQGLDSYTQMLSHDDTAENADPANAITQDIIAKNKAKWAKRAKSKSKQGSSKLLFILVGVVCLVLAGAAAAYFLLFTKSTDNASEPPELEAPPEPVNMAKSPLPESKKQPTAVKKAPATQKDDDEDDDAPSNNKQTAEELAQQRLDDMNEEFETLQEVINEEKDKDIKAEVLIFLKSFNKELQAYTSVYNYMCSVGKKKLVEKIFNEWLAEKPSSSNANYMKSIMIGQEKEAIPYLKKAIDGNIFLFPAYLKLASLYEEQNEHREAGRVYRKLLKRDPSNKEALENYLQLKAQRGDLQEGILQMQMILKDAKIPQATIATKLIKYAQQLHDSKIADDFLVDLKASPDHYADYQTNSVINKAIYGTLTEDDFFDGFYPKEIRKYHMLFLLSQHRNADVALIPTPPDEYPDFWKVFIAWQSNDALWKELSEELLKKYKRKPNGIYSLIAKLWLKKVKPGTIRKQLEKIPEHDKPLLLFLLAEYYRKKKKTIKASVLYRKALKYKTSPYRQLIKGYAPKY